MSISISDTLEQPIFCFHAGLTSGLDSLLPVTLTRTLAGIDWPSPRCASMLSILSNSLERREGTNVSDVMWKMGGWRSSPIAGFLLIIRGRPCVI